MLSQLVLMNTENKSSHSNTVNLENVHNTLKLRHNNTPYTKAHDDPNLGPLLFNKHTRLKENKWEGSKMGGAK